MSTTFSLEEQLLTERDHWHQQYDDLLTRLVECYEHGYPIPADVVDRWIRPVLNQDDE